MRNIAVVYQAGIANVFQVEVFSSHPQTRKAKRLLQHAFSPCEWYARGCKNAGDIVRSYGCNMAGDIVDQPWSSTDLGPFRDKACPVGRHDPEPVSIPQVDDREFA